MLTGQVFHEHQGTLHRSPNQALNLAIHTMGNLDLKIVRTKGTLLTKRLSTGHIDQNKPTETIKKVKKTLPAYQPDMNTKLNCTTLPLIDLQNRWT